LINIVRTIKTVAKRAVVKDWEKPTTNYWHGFWIVVAVVIIGSIARWQGYPWNGNPIAWYQANETFEQGVAASKKHDGALAISKFRDAIRQYSTDKRFYAALATEETHQNALAEATADWEKCLQIDRNQIDPWISLAQLQMVGGDLTKAEKAINHALRIDEGNADAHVMKAIVLQSQNKPQDAAKEFAKTEHMSRESARFWNFAGSYYAQIGKTQEAETALHQACETEPTNALYENAYGRFLLANKRYKDAEIYLDRAARLDTDNAEYWVALAQSFYGEGDIKRAIRAFKKASDLKPSDWQRLEELGNLQMVDKDFNAAADSFKRAAEIVPKRRKLWDSEIKALFAANRFADAKITVVRFINLTPENQDNPVAWQYLAQLLEKENAKKEAQNAYEKAIELSKSAQLTAFCRQKLEELKK
jgi:tetratricopeptide (TPR) repeat protein